MPITLTVEDGTGVANANSFATLIVARGYASDRGVALSSDDEALKVLLINSTDYLKSLRYVGTKANLGQQYLPWPRVGLKLDGVDFPADAVPQDIVWACAQLCVEQQNGIVLSQSASGPSVKAETVGPIQTVYAGTSRGARPRMPAVDALLAGWVVPSSVLSVNRA